MKIVILSSHTPSLFWFRLDMMQAFIASGHEVVAVGNEDVEEWWEKFKEIGVKYRQVYVERNGTNIIKDLRTLKELKVILKEEKPNKIFCYQAKTVIYGCIAAKKLKIKEVYPLIAGIGSVFFAQKFIRKIIKRILIFEYRYALKNSKNVFFQNKDDSAVFLKYKMCASDKIVYINGSGVNIEKFIPMSLPNIPAFLCISRLIKDKGIREYLQACRIVKEKHPEYRCLLVGPFDSNPSAIKKEELDVYINDNVIEYFGEQKDVRPFIEQSSVFVLPSYREGVPKTILEAMACARPIITTDVPGCKETVENGINGYLVPVKNVQALAEKMLELIKDESLVEKMGKEGRKLVEDKFTVNLINKKIIEVMNL